MNSAGKVQRLLLIFSMICLLSSCYRMPEEGEVSVVPITNNPTITRQPPSTFLPGMEQ